MSTAKQRDPNKEELQARYERLALAAEAAHADFIMLNSTVPGAAPGAHPTSAAKSHAYWQPQRLAG
jgi:hypothetical protein